MLDYFKTAGRDRSSYHFFTRLPDTPFPSRSFLFAIRDRDVFNARTPACGLWVQIHQRVYLFRKSALYRQSQFSGSSFCHIRRAGIKIFWHYRGLSKGCRRRVTLHGCAGHAACRIISASRMSPYRHRSRPRRRRTERLPTAIASAITAYARVNAGSSGVGAYWAGSISTG